MKILCLILGHYPALGADKNGVVLCARCDKPLIRIPV